MTKLKSDYSIQTVTNALRVLEVFTDEDEIGVSELSRRLDLHKNNVFRLLATLEENGYIEQSTRSEEYRLGPGCLELGRSFARGNGLIRCARSVLVELSKNVGETAHIAVLRESEVVHLDCEEANRLIMTSSRVGLRLPAHCTALGKVLLASENEATRACYEKEILAGSGLEARTRSTITDPQKFLEHLSSVAVQGSAVDFEECEVGLCCAAAPIHDGHGNLVGALSVSGPSSRMTTDSMHGTILPAVVAAADGMSHKLGL
jgi:IclR family KDG regulon transcriptional repressor